jgi:hypothetical protein
VKKARFSGFPYRMETTKGSMRKPAFAMKRAFLLLLFLSAGSLAYPIQITMTSGGSGWTYPIPASGLPTVPGRNLSTTSVTSSAASPYQTVLSVKKDPGWSPSGTGWIISIHKINVSWHPNLTLSVRRRGNGTPTGNLVGTTIYKVIPDDPSEVEFVRCNSHTEVSDINCQFRIQNISAAVGTTNQTTVYYTVTEF